MEFETLTSQMDVLIPQNQYMDLIRQSEQLRILKNLARNEKIFMTEMLYLIDAMEVKENE